jgi:hypothetical protein
MSYWESPRKNSLNPPGDGNRNQRIERVQNSNSTISHQSIDLTVPLLSMRPPVAGTTSLRLYGRLFLPFAQLAYLIDLIAADFRRKAPRKRFTSNVSSKTFRT